MPADRTGPALTVLASCHACGHWVNHRWDNACSHPQGSPEKIQGSTTPARCPLLPAARLALGRELVGARAESRPAADVLAAIVGPALGTAGEKRERITADEWWSRQMAKMCRAPVACNREAPTGADRSDDHG